MTKTILLAGAAVALATTPAYGQEATGSLTFNNNIDTSLVTDITFTSDIEMDGDVSVEGDIEVDSAATAVSDHKQIVDGNLVIFDEAIVDEDEDGFDDDDESSAVNQAGGVDVDADGNVGVNSAAGQYNSQANVATIAVASGGEEIDDDDEGIDDDHDGGMATANTTSAQSLTNTYYGPEFDDEEDDPYFDVNRAVAGNVGGAGNIGVNAAAGAFNMQQNIMTLAVADDSSLAAASAGVVQFSNANMVIVNDTDNATNIGLIDGAGNIAVNVAAGVGNMQHNSLTVAASGAFGGNGTGGAGAGGIGDGNGDGGL